MEMHTKKQGWTREERPLKIVNGQDEEFRNVPCYSFSGQNNEFSDYGKRNRDMMPCQEASFPS